VADRELVIAGLIGSLRRVSLNRWLYEAAAELAPAGMRLVEAPIGDLPHYNDDIDVDGGPPAARAFRERIRAADGLLFVTPEFNYSIPGALKNAIDWASRPTGRSVIYGKPAAVMGAAAGRSGSMRAQMHLRQIFVPLNIQGLNKPEIIVTFAREKFDADGLLIDEDLRAQVAAQMLAFKCWIELLKLNPQSS
jgi:chromate reductase